MSLAYADLAVGDCLYPVEDTDDDNVIVAFIRRCDEPHLMEVFGIPALEFPVTAPFPGEDRIARESEDACRVEFKSYVGIDFSDSSLSARFYSPSADAWIDGDRLVVCIVDSEEDAPLTRSVKDSES